MMNALYLVCLIPLGTGAQESQSASTQVSKWIAELSSQKVERRQEAVQKLRDLGTVAVPELQKAARSTDAEVASRAEGILRWIALDEMFHSSTKKAIPRIVERLYRGDDYEWARVLLEGIAVSRGLEVPRGGLTEKELGGLRIALSILDADVKQRKKEPLFNEADLVSLVVPALKGAKTASEKIALSLFAATWKCRASVPQLIELLQHKNGTVRGEVARALGELGAKEATSALMRLLKDKHVYARQFSISALTALRASEAAEQVSRLLNDADRSVKLAALTFLIRMQSVQLLPQILRKFDDDEVDIVLLTKDTWRQLGGQQLIPSLTKLLEHQDKAVRRGARKALKLISGFSR